MDKTAGIILALGLVFGLIIISCSVAGHINRSYRLHLHTPYGGITSERDFLLD